MVCISIKKKQLPGYVNNLYQRFSTCGTWKAHMWYPKKVSLYKKKLNGQWIHIKYYLAYLILI